MIDSFILFAQDDPYRFMKASLFGTAMLATAIFLILLVLVQRGRGGGLAGAFGGAGGQSAFGAKAGDTFTKVTIYASTFWILLCIAALVVLNPAPPAEAAPESGISAPGGAGTTGGATTDGEEVTGEDGTEEAGTDGTEETGTDGTEKAGADDAATSGDGNEKPADN